MAQLTDDCFAFGGPLLTVDDVERLIAARVNSLTGTETVQMSAALGRVLAHDLISRIALPSFDNSAVDGYAVAYRGLNTVNETRLSVHERILAGHAGTRAVGPGEAARIFTGAPMPGGADTVFMQEDVRIDGDHVIVPAGLKRGANRRLKGEDVKAGQAVLPQGCRLAPQHVAMASAVGETHAVVRRRVRVALFSTGDEIIAPGSPLRGAAVHDANRPLLASMAAKLGAEITDLGILADEVDSLSDALKRAAASHDLVVTSGGVSTGEADYVRTAVERVGKLVFWRTAIKPGRPVAMGVLPGADAGESAAFVGLPGNPVAAFVTFARIVRPLILRLGGALPEPMLAFPVCAAFGYRKKTGRREYVRVALIRAADGTIEAHKFAQDGAGVISSMTETDGLVELPEDITGVEPGDMVGFLSYAAFIG